MPPNQEANPLVEGAQLPKYPKKKKVTRAIICNGIKDIEDRHPMRQTAGWGQISCCCKLVCCCAKKKKPFKSALRECILDELELKFPKEDLSDPYIVMGYGVNAYYQILASLAKMFFWIFVFALPLMYIYASGQHYDGQPSKPISQFMMGNFGGSTMMCKSQRAETKEIEIECPGGTVFGNSNYAQIGSLSNAFTSFTWCNQVAIDKELDKKGYQNCTAEMSKNATATLRQQLNETCKHQTKCTIPFDKLFTKESKECNHESYLFIQNPCIIPSNRIKERKIMGLGIACLGVFIYLFMFLSVEYTKAVQDIMFVEWDVKTISAADYTCEFGITEDMYEEFVNKYLDETNPISEIGQFRSYVKDEMEARLTSFPGLGIDGDEGDEAPVKIAIVTFAFDNAEIIHNLTKRGIYIRQQKWAKYEKINEKIVKRLHDSQELLDQMQTPVYCFLTFESEEGKCRCDIYNDTVQLPDYTHYKTFLGAEIDMQGASEPTDIIWENRHFSDLERFKRTMIVCAILFGVLCCSFALIYTCQKTALAMKQKYPKMKCDTYNVEYNGRREAWIRDSMNEYVINDAIEEKGGVALFTGPMQCFCQMEHKNKVNKKEVYELKDANGTVTFKEQICLQYQNDKLMSKILALSITVIVVAVNTIIKKVVVALVSWIGEDTISQQKATVVKGAFIGQFFNTGFIILIVNANMGEHEPKQFWKVFNGPFYDYVPQWYIDVGLKIVTTYLVQGLMPYINVVKESVIARLKICVDQKCSGNRYKSRSHTLQMYKAAYTGKEWPIHFKYSDALNITFLAMMYGMHMPIMFFMAMIIISNQRLGERVQVAYNMRQPPAMDNALSNSVLSILKFAPLLLLFNGFWLLDNRQSFDNYWFYKNKSTDYMKSGHKVGFHTCQSSPMLLAGILCLLVVIIQVVVPSDVLKKAGFTMAVDDLDVDEDLPNFFKVLPLREANRVIAEHDHMQKEYGFELHECTLIEKLENTQWPNRPIQGTPWYSLMSNPKYVEDFSYLGPHIKDRNSLIRDHDHDTTNNYQQSDVVSILTNLGAIPDFVARKFHLGNNFAVDFMGFMNEYKENYEKEHGVKWQYTNDKLLDRYFAFKRTRESFTREPRKENENEGGMIEMMPQE